MKYILALFLAGFSAFAADTPIAVVRGTNVLFAAIADTNRFTPPAGASNIVITAAEVSVIGKGWRYVAGEFLRPDGSPIAKGDKVRIDRAKLVDAAVAKLNTMQAAGTTAVANWASLTAAQKDIAQKQTIDAVVTVSKILELLLLEQRALLELKETE